MSLNVEPRSVRLSGSGNEGRFRHIQVPSSPLDKEEAGNTGPPGITEPPGITCQRNETALKLNMTFSHLHDLHLFGSFYLQVLMISVSLLSFSHLCLPHTLVSSVLIFSILIVPIIHLNMFFLASFDQLFSVPRSHPHTQVGPTGMMIV